MKILLTNNKSKLEGPAKLLVKLRNHPVFAIRVNGAFFSTAYQKGHWDGYLRFISEAGYVETGKVPQVIALLEEWGEDVTIIDKRDTQIKALKIPRKINGWEVRDYQYDALKSIKNNKLKDISFPRGVIGAATNAGKTLIACGIFTMYQRKTLFLINSKELLEQALEEIPKILPGRVGWLASSVGENWNDFMIVMVQTALSRIDRIGNRLAQYNVVLVDECDLATSASYKKVLGYTFNSFVRIGLSGSAFADKRKKDKNEKLRGIFGDIIYEIKNIDLMNKGFSSRVKVYVWNGNTTIKEKGDWAYEYDQGIIHNKRRNKGIIKRAKVHIKHNRLPMLIIVKNHKHVNNLFKLVAREEAFQNLRVDWVHHKREGRQEIVRKFKDGQLDILVGSYILKRGKNFPLMKAIINGGAGDSIANVLQILGRATRKHKDKEYTYMDDFYDKGAYLRRHSLHRFTTYKNEGIEVLDRVHKELLK